MGPLQSLADLHVSGNFAQKTREQDITFGAELAEGDLDGQDFAILPLGYRRLGMPRGNS